MNTDTSGSVEHLLIGCPLYQDDRRKAGIARDTTLHFLLFTQRGTLIPQEFIQTTKVATRRWLLQDSGGREGEGEWGWGGLREETERDGEAECRKERVAGVTLFVISFSFPSPSSSTFEDRAQSREIARTETKRQRRTPPTCSRDRGETVGLVPWILDLAVPD